MVINRRVLVYRGTFVVWQEFTELLPTGLGIYFARRLTVLRRLLQNERRHVTSIQINYAISSRTHYYNINILHLGVTPTVFIFKAIKSKP